MNAHEVVMLDLDSMCANLKDEFTALSGKRVLITGGAGFLGHYFIQSALHWNNHVHAQGAPIQVVVYDSFVRGMPQWLSKAEADPNLVLIRHDIRNPLPDDGGDFQFIIHAASIASPTYYKRDPIGTMDANVNGLRMLLEYARGQKEKGRPVEGFLFFSSSEIYGQRDRAAKAHQRHSCCWWAFFISVASPGRTDPNARILSRTHRRLP